MIVCVGEAILDLVSRDGIDYRAKAGGSALNASVCGARLNAPFALLARLAEDAFGQFLRSYLYSNSVDLSLIVHAPEQTTLAVATTDADGDATYNFYRTGTADWQWTRGELADRLPAGVQALMFGSMSLEVDPGARHLLDLAAREHERAVSTILFDPNVRLASGPAGASRAEAMVRWSDLIKVSEDDLERLYPDRDPFLVAADWANLGPAIVFLTQAERGATAFRTGLAPISVAAKEVDVEDSIGAGDAFCAALLVALRERELLGPGSRRTLRTLDQETLTEIMRFSCDVATLSCQNIGANPPYRDPATGELHVKRESELGRTVD
jgi:fructokinase